jgi:hypothetical protein
MHAGVESAKKSWLLFEQLYGYAAEKMSKGAEWLLKEELKIPSRRRIEVTLNGSQKDPSAGLPSLS